MRQHAPEFADGPRSPSSRPAQSWRPESFARGDAPFGLSALRASLRERPGRSGGTRVATAAVEDDILSAEKDAPTNVFALAQYRYQLTVSTIAMADCELAVLLPRSGHIWFNATLFKKIPRGREGAQRDAWLHAIDTSGAVRFLLAWSLALYSTAHFRGVPHEDLPGWSRVISFGPRLADCPKSRLDHWSDVLQEVTRLLAPPTRVWRQLQVYAPVSAGDRRWQLAVARHNHNVDDVIGILADRNQCPETLIRRSLDGNGRLASYQDYLRFTDSLLQDVPQLRSQRFLASHGRDEEAPLPPPRSGPPTGRLFGEKQGRWRAAMDDPRQAPDFWQLHL